MFTDGKIWIAKNDERIFIEPSMANRHGLIAGATGTGKTVTLKVMAESFSDMGVPVFLSDVKGDLSGMCCPGEDSESIQKRITKFGIDGFNYKAYPTAFWDVFGEKGTPVRVTVSNMGPMILSRLFNLTDAQQGCLNIVFKVADDNGLLLLDLKDLRAMLQYVGDNRAEFTTQYGNISAASIGAIQRALLSFEEEGGSDIFGEPELNIFDWMRTDCNGKGYINVLSSERLVNSPTTYAMFLLWMLTELFEKLPEVGDVEKPRMVFFFDEAHLLFTDAKKALVTKIMQVVKLIRSKGVGVYFISQSPSDIPDEVLAQLSNRIQHALRAYTPAEIKAVKACAQSFRVNPEFDTATAITELGVGEALVSFLDKEGVPGIVQRANILPPQSLMGAADDQSITRTINLSEFELKYRAMVDRESAYEIIMRANAQLEEERAAAEAEKIAAKEAAAAEKAAAKEAAAAEKAAAKEAAAAEKAAAKEKAAAEKAAAKATAERNKTAKKAVTSAASSVAGSVSRNLVNSVTGGKTTSAKTIATRAASNALSSVARSGASALIRGLFGNLK